MKIKYKIPANGGHLVFCPHCGKKMEPFKKSTIKYCLDCQRGFAVYHGSSTGTIGIYQLTEVEMVAGKMERIEDDD